MKSCSARHRGSSSLRTCSKIYSEKKNNVGLTSSYRTTCEHTANWITSVHLWQCHLVKLGPVRHVQIRGGHVTHIQQWGRLGAPAVGALHCQLVQAWGRACQLPWAAMKAWHGTTNTQWDFKLLARMSPHFGNIIQITTDYMEIKGLVLWVFTIELGYVVMHKQHFEHLARTNQIDGEVMVCKALSVYQGSTVKERSRVCN